ncbi:SIS domain-containing protein [Pantoea osteomyelitidis]|uniref:SIS domain-containing protein n=1 Tax=Pantoea osteomyelitidis TaxID=3230026 RepID=A0ABW7PZX9_9GAMM
MSAKLQGKEIILLARTLSPTLGKKERAIARFIENNPDTLATMTISDIADFLKVSVSSITKVAKKLGFSGFYDLKMNLNQAGIVEEEYFDYSQTQGDFCLNILQNTFLSAVLALQESVSVLDIEVFKKVAALLSAVTAEQRIILAGSGGSGAICDDFHHKLLKIGIFASVYHDAHLQQMAASLMKPGDILLGISHSGKTSDIINTMKTAKANQAATICITNYPNSPLSHLADYALVSAVRNNPITGENATTRIVHLNILDALFTVVASKRSELSQISLQKTRDSVQAKRAAS